VPPRNGARTICWIDPGDGGYGRPVADSRPDGGHCGVNPIDDEAVR
jgi:hypothetical protein